MTDVVYLCHNCGSVHQVELVPENLILVLCAAGHRARRSSSRLARLLTLLVIRGPLRRARIQPGFALRYQ
jgi:hypothetical protein